MLGIMKPVRLLREVMGTVPPGKALDLACGAGRNALGLAELGWKVVAVDRSAESIGAIKTVAAAQRLNVETHVADLEAGQFTIQPESFDLVILSYYLQRDLFEPAKVGVVPGGLLVAIALCEQPDGSTGRFRAKAGELRGYFQDWEILHDYEGPSRDGLSPGHTPGQEGDTPDHRWVAELVARKRGRLYF